ncbi:MAG: MBL fold metallo-hydrolase [Elusimicrobia bacterium]|nr:MBL fold metallo-hydrolase [Elusimicrobiota bacterium]
MLRRQGLRVGRFEVFLLSDGRFRLDGGAMYGVVPKSLWCRHEDVDDKNRVLLDLGCLLIKTPAGKNVLVDAGLSSKFDSDAKFKSVYAVVRQKTLRDGLKEHGLAPSDIDLVINTHLHFDHAGGDTEFDASGRPVPAFPKARYVVQRQEWEDANHPHERNAASYMEENYAVLGERKVLELVDGEAELEPGLKAVRTGGHCAGHQGVLIESEGQAAFYLGDTVPTRAHVPLPYIMAYDLFPLDTLDFKRNLYERALKGDWLLLFDHDATMRSAKLALEGGRYKAA